MLSRVKRVLVGLRHDLAVGLTDSGLQAVRYKCLFLFFTVLIASYIFVSRKSLEVFRYGFFFVVVRGRCLSPR